MTTAANANITAYPSHTADGGRSVGSGTAAVCAQHTAGRKIVMAALIGGASFSTIRIRLRIWRWDAPRKRLSGSFVAARRKGD